VTISTVLPSGAARATASVPESPVPARLPFRSPGSAAAVRHLKSASRRARCRRRPPGRERNQRRLNGARRCDQARPGRNEVSEGGNDREWRQALPPDADARRCGYFIASLGCWRRIERSILWVPGGGVEVPVGHGKPGKNWRVHSRFTLCRVAGGLAMNLNPRRHSLMGLAIGTIAGDFVVGCSRQ